MRTGSQTSKVWNYFQRIDRSTCCCRICEKVLKYTGSTGNMKIHLRKKHPLSADLNSLSIETCDQTLSFTIPSSTTTAAADSCITANIKNKKSVEKRMNSFAANEINELTEKQIHDIDNSLVKMILTNLQYFSLIENEWFLEYSKCLQPLYNVPHNERLRDNIIPKFYAELVLTQKSLLSTIKYTSITADIWTIDNSQVYITVVAYFIHMNQLHNKILSTKEIDLCRTSQSISNVMKTILNEWEITEKVVAVVCDNGISMKCTITEHLNLHYRACIVHTINISVIECINDNNNLARILKKCQTIIDYLKYNPVAADRLMSIQNQMGVPIFKVEQEDISTSCNPYFVMLDYLLKIKDPLFLSVLHSSDAPEFLDESEWTVIENCMEILKLVNHLSNTLSTNKCPTISLIIPLIRGLQSTLKKMSVKNESTKTFRNSLLNTISKKAEEFESDEIIAKATFLDPRFKKIAFGLSVNANNAEQLVIKEIEQLFISKNDFVESYFEEEVEICELVWTDFDRQIAKTNKNTPSDTVLLKVKQYVDLPYLNRKEDPFRFWSKYEQSLPELYELAIKYLSIPSTSVFSKQISSGLITCLKHNKFYLDKLDEILFLHENKL